MLCSAIRTSARIVGMASTGRRSSSKMITRQNRAKQYRDSDDEEDYSYSLPSSLGASYQYTTAPRKIEAMRPRNPAQERYFDLLEHIVPPIVVAAGAAGTGKSSIAVSIAIKKLFENEYQKIVISRPAVSVEEEHGFLPGTLEEKMDPWMRPLYDTFYKYYSPDQVKALIAKKTIEICPIAYLRGRTFENSFVIIDETQNCTVNQMLMILTRIGRGSKMVITGDPDQADRGYETNGLSDLMRKLGGREEENGGIQTVVFTEADVERHPVIRHILRLYKETGVRG